MDKHERNQSTRRTKRGGGLKKRKTTTTTNNDNNARDLDRSDSHSTKTNKNFFFSFFQAVDPSIDQSINQSITFNEKQTKTNKNEKSFQTPLSILFLTDLAIDRIF